jgi:hypothetical protein
MITYLIDIRRYDGAFLSPKKGLPKIQNYTSKRPSRQRKKGGLFHKIWGGQPPPGATPWGGRGQVLTLNKSAESAPRKEPEKAIFLNGET